MQVCVGSVVREVILFFCLGWGAGSPIPTLIQMPAFSRIRGNTAVFILASFQMCQWRAVFIVV